MTENWPKTLDQIVFTSLKSYKTDFQTNIKDFQSHGNKSTEDTSHPIFLCEESFII